jgi:hypothetical protein
VADWELSRWCATNSQAPQQNLRWIPVVGKTFLVTFGETSYSGDFTTTWSYQTSDDEFSAGRDSGAFLVPNLNVKYTQVTTIVDACSASEQTLFKLNLESQANKPVLSFLSVYNVENRPLPTFDEMLAGKRAENQAEIQKENSDSSTLEKLGKEITALEEGLDGWQTTMIDYDATNEMDDGSLAVPRDWFTGWVREKDILSQIQKTGMSCMSPAFVNLRATTGMPTPIIILRGSLKLANRCQIATGR